MVSKISITIENTNKLFDMYNGINESYEVNINESHIIIHAQNMFGYNHALSTVSQLVTEHFDDKIANNA